MSQTISPPRDSAHQQFLTYLDGGNGGLAWLEQHRPGLACLLRAFEGGPKARQKLKELPAPRWDEIFEAIASEELEQHLLAFHQEERSLFAAVKGDEDALKLLRRHKPSYVALAGIIREAHERSLAASNTTTNNGKLHGDDAADVGCLLGEMHLGKGEYDKAVEAFTRAINNEPSADALEGRARAFRALAAMDEALRANYAAIENAKRQARHSSSSSPSS